MYVFSIKLVSIAVQVSFVTKRGTQEDEDPDITMVVDLEKYAIPDGTRCVCGIRCW